MKDWYMKIKAFAALWGQRNLGIEESPKKSTSKCFLLSVSQILDEWEKDQPYYGNHFYIQRNRKQLTICKQMDNPTGFVFWSQKSDLNEKNFLTMF